jgi:outer membrane protein TolC
MMETSLHLMGKGAMMRSPHRRAEANQSRGAARPRGLILAILVALASGCVMQEAPRIIEGEQGLKDLGLNRPAPAAAVAGSVARPPGGPPAASATATTGPAPVAASSTTSTDSSSTAAAPEQPGRPDQRLQRVAIATARAVQLPLDGDATPTPASLRAASGEMVPAPEVIPQPSGDYPIDLASSLRLADRVNPTINRARSVVLEALALQLTARTLLVPSLNGGASYRGHNGPLQRSSGTIVDNSLQSLFIGAGGYVDGSSPPRLPGVNILTPLTDAIFQPLAARQRVIASRFNVKATENDILVDVAVLHLELLRQDTLLEAHRLSEIQAYQIVQTIEQYAIAGQGRKSDYDRARADWRYRRADVIDAQQNIGIAAARLAQRLNLDPSVRLRPAGGPLMPIHLVALETSPEDLIQVALKQRPDLAARTAEIGQAEMYVKQEIGRPLLPTLWLGYSGGAFGGGSNLTPPLLGHFGGRSDFEVQVYWTLLGGGFGNLALIRQRQAEAGEAVAVRARNINRARDEVMEALADARASRNQIDIARRELRSSHEGFHEDLERSRQNLGRPIEVLNSLNLLAAARARVIDAIIRYNQAQFRLWVALGTPPPLVETSAADEPAVPDYLKP